MSELHQLCGLYSWEPSDSRISGAMNDSSPRHPNLPSAESLSRTGSQMTTYAWAVELQQPFWFIYCYSQEFLLSCQLHALHGNSSLSRRAPSWLLVYAANFWCSSESWFCMLKSQAHKHCSRQFRLLGTVCLMLLQALIKWNKFHHSPLKRSIPLFFQNMSAGCWQIPDVAALMLSCCQEPPAAHAVLTFLALLANFVSFPAAPGVMKKNSLCPCRSP